MLELRPTCENCNKPLPPESREAMICSFECTYCSNCVEDELEGICPNCGGNFALRPIRPAQNWKNKNYLGQYPASKKIVSRKINIEEHRKLISRIKFTPPHLR